MREAPMRQCLMALSCAATGLSLATNSTVNAESSDDDDSSSEEETLAGKGAATVRRFLSWF